MNDADDVREDEIDLVVKEARLAAMQALQLLMAVMHDEEAIVTDRIKAAQHILEVSGCLSL